MCGIVSVIGQIGVKEETLFTQLLEVDSLRGRHSTGVVKVEGNGNVSTKKKAVDGMDFVKLEKTWIGLGLNKVLIGHNRWATKGAVNDVNAHPFTHGHIHGVHNGTLTSQFGLKDYTSFEVDSDNIFYDIAHGSVTTTVPKLRGAYAIVLYDEKAGEVNIFRNEQRELAMAILNDGKTIVVASEYLMLEWVLQRNGYVDKKGEPTYRMIEMLDPNKKVSFKPFAKGVNKTAKSIVDTMKIEKLEPYVYIAPKVVEVKKPLLLEGFGLDANTYYPLELVECKTTAIRDNIEFYLKMMCHPFAMCKINTFTSDSEKRVRRMLDSGSNMVSGKLTVPYNPAPNDKHKFTVYLTEVKSIDEQSLNLIEEELPPVKDTTTKKI